MVISFFCVLLVLLVLNCAAGADCADRGIVKGGIKIRDELNFFMVKVISR